MWLFAPSGPAKNCHRNAADDFVLWTTGRVVSITQSLKMSANPKRPPLCPPATRLKTDVLVSLQQPSNFNLQPTRTVCPVLKKHLTGVTLCQTLTEKSIIRWFPANWMLTMKMFSRSSLSIRPNLKVRHFNWPQTRVSKITEKWHKSCRENQLP